MTRDFYGEMEMSTIDNELLGEPKMTMRQFWEEERRAREAEAAERSSAWTSGYCCVMAAMHMGHDDDCEGYGEDVPEWAKKRNAMPTGEP